MRARWIVVGLVLVIGGVAWWKLHQPRGDGADRGRSTTPAAFSPAPASALSKSSEAVPAPADPGLVTAAQDAAEERAREILAELAKAHAAKDRAAYDAALARLEAEAWDALSAQRFAVKLGWAQLEEGKRLSGADRMRRLDASRRLLSRGVWLPELFDARGDPTTDRGRLLQAIQESNREVMTYAKHAGGGLAGITRPYPVPPGEAPLSTVSLHQLPYGPNALLFWNKGHLDARRVQAGEILLLPEEALRVEVDREHRRLALFIGDWFVKDFAVGIGRPDKPTPQGTFAVGAKRQENPDWYSPGGFIPYGDPRNELGSVWIGIAGDSLPEDAGIGLHGTNKPQTVGTPCSNGCVRLQNEDATELYRWVRGRDKNGGTPTPIVIR